MYPGPRHWEIVFAQHAHLAALAIKAGVTLLTPIRVSPNVAVAAFQTNKGLDLSLQRKIQPREHRLKKRQTRNSIRSLASRFLSESQLSRDL